MTPTGHGGGRELARALQGGRRSPGSPEREEAQSVSAGAGARECSRSWLGWLCGGWTSKVITAPDGARGRGRHAPT